MRKLSLILTFDILTVVPAVFPAAPAIVLSVAGNGGLFWLSPAGT